MLPSPIGPGGIPVIRIGNDVYTCSTRVSNENGAEVTTRQFDLRVGSASPHPFDKSVRDETGKIVGYLDTSERRLLPTLE